MMADKTKIDITLIDPNPQQPRAAFDPDGLEELSKTIELIGVIQPISVRAADGRFILIDGERRLRAAKLAGLEQIPAYVISADDDPQKSLERAVVANVQRAKLNPIELGHAFQQMKDDFGLTDEQIATRIYGGKSKRSYVANLRRLLALPPEQQQRVISGAINERSAIALAGLYTLPDPLQAAILEQPPTEIFKQATTSEQIRATIQAATHRHSKRLTEFEPDEDVYGVNIRHLQCIHCDYYVRVNGDSACTDPECFRQKSIAYGESVLAEAVATTGLDPLEEGEIMFPFSEFQAGGMAKAIKDFCPNLRIRYQPDNQAYLSPNKAHDNVIAGCCKKIINCSCCQSLHAVEQGQQELINRMKADEARLEAIPRLLPILEDCPQPVIYLIADLLGVDPAKRVAASPDPVKTLALELIAHTTKYNYDRPAVEYSLIKWQERIGLDPENRE